MQFKTPIGDIITQQQTIHPYTTEVRIFNQKESNSTDNCVGGICDSKKDVIDSYMKDVTKNVNKLTKEMRNAELGVDNRNGLIKVNDNFSAETGEAYDQNHPNIGDIIYNSSSVSGPSPFIAETIEDNRYMDPTNMDEFNNFDKKDYAYNSYADWRAPTFDQWTRLYDDNCNEENRAKMGTKPMKYFVNQFNSPQVDPSIQYAFIGNQKQYDVRNEFERAIPTRLNPIYPVDINPYLTSPFLGSANPSRMYPDTSEALRFGVNSMRDKKSALRTSEVDFNRYDVVPEITVQNAGQFNAILQKNPSSDGYYDYTSQNNVLFGNSSSVPYWGISSRDLLHNIAELGNC